MRPRTLRNIPIYIQHLAEEQDIDPDFNQVMGDLEYETDEDGNPKYELVKGQPVFQNKEMAGMSQGGATRETSGYILMEKKEAEKIKKFDKIVEINREELEAPVYINEKNPDSFSGSSNLVKVVFSDRTDIDA